MDSTNILLGLIVVLLVVVVWLLLRPTAETRTPPPMVITLPARTAATGVAIPPPALAEPGHYGHTTMTYRTDVPLTPAGESLNRYYPQAPKGIPTDYTMDSCPCPFRKPQKTDLPMPSLPLCTLLSQTSYKLSEMK